MLTTVPQQDTGDLDQPQVVGGLLLVAHQNGAAFREPAQFALHHPSPPRVTLLPGAIFLLLADAPYVGGVAAGLHRLLDLRSLVVALVQAQMLGRPLRRLWTLDHHGVERGFEQLEVRYVRPGHYDSQRPSPDLHQQGALHPVFASIGGIGAYLWSPKTRLAHRSLHLICVVRMRHDQRTREYVARRTAEGKSKREIMRCLKRYIARESYRLLAPRAAASPPTASVSQAAYPRKVAAQP